MSEILDKILSPIFTLIGVALGGWLTPWVSDRLQKRKNKTELKAKIIKSVYIFFNLFKHQFQVSNWFGFHVRRLVYTEKLIAKRKSEKKDTKELDDIKEMIEKHIAQEKETQENNFDKLGEIESEVVYLLSQVEDHYGREVYQEIDSLIKPHIDKSNFGLMMYEYLTLNDEEYLNLTQRFSKEIKEKYYDLARDADTIINVLSKIR